MVVRGAATGKAPDDNGIAGTVELQGSLVIGQCWLGLVCCFPR